MTNIKKSREKAGLSQKYVALSLGVSAPTVSDWENGKINPSIKNLKSLASLFGVSIDYLLDFESAKKAPEENLPELEEHEIVFLNAFRNCTSDDQQHLFALVRRLSLLTHIEPAIAEEVLVRDALVDHLAGLRDSQGESPEAVGK